MKLIEELIDIYLEGSQDEMRHILNRQNGEILFDAPHITGEPEIDLDDEESECLLEIPTSSTSEMYRVMVDFSTSQSEDHSTMLLDVLEGKKPFRRFKDKLIELGIDEMWYRFERDYAKGEVEAWLERQGIKIGKE